MRGWAPAGLALAAILAVGIAPSAQSQSPQDPETPRFKSGVELINVTATVSDSTGRFVSGLSQDDFAIYEDEEPQVITQFSAERVPVSLGLALDTSGSMAGEKIRSAQGALRRFLELLDPRDEMFLYAFNNDPVLLQGWTNDRRLLSRALESTFPSGGTAMYDAVARSISLAGTGRHQKRALVIISDGNDTLSRVKAPELKTLIRESDVLVYAIGIDGETIETAPSQAPKVGPRPPFPVPPPIPPPGSPGRRGRGRGWILPALQPPVASPPGGWWSRRPRGDDRVNVAALRDLTDHSGGRTEVVAIARDLDPATAGIADELSRQYDLAYASNRKKDGRWHSIRVEVRGHPYRVRARRGYVAS